MDHIEKQSLTVGEIARRLGIPVHRVEYFVKSRNIKPVSRAGKLRIFSEEVFEALHSRLEGEGLH